MLVALLDKCPGALRADFQHAYGLDLDDLWSGGIGVLRAADLAYNLPAGSVSWQAIDSPAAWTVNDYLNAALYDSFAMFCWGMGDEKTRGPQPTPLPRPGKHGTPDRHVGSGRYKAMSVEEYDAWRAQRFNDVKADTHMPRRS